MPTGVEAGFTSTARRLIPDFDRVRRRRPGVRGSSDPASARATIPIDSTSKPLLSRNVVGRVVGTDLKEGARLFSSHWDHFGRNEAGVFHGALDNAAGSPASDGARTSLPASPRRFDPVHGNDGGGVRASARSSMPRIPHPLEKTVANVDMDIPNPWGRTRSW